MSSPAKLFPVMAAMGAVKGLTGIASGIIGSGKRKREQRQAQGEYNRLKDKLFQKDTSNPYANMENAFEDLTVNTQQNEMIAQQQNQQQANIMQQMQGAAGGSGIAALAQAMANQGSQNIQQNMASVGQQEQANQMAKARAAEQNDQLERKGAMMQREMENNQLDTQFGMAGKRLARANEARAAATQSIIGGATQALGSGMQLGNILGQSTNPGGFGGGGQDGFGNGMQNHQQIFGQGGNALKNTFGG